MNWTRANLAEFERRGQSPIAKIVAQDRFRSKWERQYADLLTSEGVAWKYEPVKLRLAANTFYTPDFMLPGSPITFIEVKGFWRDDARVKLKVAAEMFPMFTFIAVTKDRRTGEWKEERIKGGM